MRLQDICERLNELNFNEYQVACAIFDRSPMTPEYYALGLTGEAGETAELIKKSMRLGTWCQPIEGKRKDELKLELGDVLWYIARMADMYGWALEEIAEANIRKLNIRHARIEGKNAANLPDRVPAES